jgi:hypothetical protein
LNRLDDNAGMEKRYDSQADIVWIKKYDPLPTTCCDCGMFTDNQVTVKHVDLVTRPGTENDGCGPILLTLFVHVALGPVGWILSALMGSDDPEKTKIVKQKSRIKIAQCRLCHGVRPPEVVESRGGSFAFFVHPRFKQELESMQRESEQGLY